MNCCCIVLTAAGERNMESSTVAHSRVSILENRQIKTYVTLHVLQIVTLTILDIFMCFFHR